MLLFFRFDCLGKGHAKEAGAVHESVCPHARQVDDVADGGDDACFADCAKK